MNKKLSVLIFVLLLMSVGINCFAQSTDSKIIALQGEWLCIKLQQGNIIYNLAESPFVEMVESIWKFDGNNFFSVSKNLQDGTSQVDTATFTVVGESLVMSYKGKSDAYSYTLTGNILMAEGDGYIFTLRKRQ